MDITLPWLGILGVRCLRLLHILDVMEAKSAQIFNEKKKAVENEDSFDDGPKDVVATLREFWFAPPFCCLTAIVRGSKDQAEDALEESAILSQIQTMVFA